MKVMKFGGTSVGSPERIKGVAELVTKSEGTTLHGPFSYVWNNELIG